MESNPEQQAILNAIHEAIYPDRPLTEEYLQNAAEALAVTLAAVSLASVMMAVPTTAASTKAEICSLANKILAFIAQNNADTIESN